MGVGIRRVYGLDGVEQACELAIRVFAFDLLDVSPRVFSVAIVHFRRYECTHGMSYSQFILL